MKRLFRNAVDLFSLKKNDILLVSYPKTGNTWLRFFLCNYILLLQGKNQAVDFAFLNEKMPEVGYNLMGSGNFFGIYPRLVKTHKKFIPPFSKKKSVYIIRDPFSTVKSYFAYNKGMQKPFSDVDTFSDFAVSENGIKAYLEHHKSWKRYIGCLVKFESLRDNPHESFRKIVEYIGLPYKADLVDIAIERSDKKAIKKLDKDSPNIGHKEKFKSNYVFAGNNASKMQSKLSQKDIEFWNEQLRTFSFDLYPELPLLV